VFFVSEILVVVGMLNVRLTQPSYGWINPQLN